MTRFIIFATLLTVQFAVGISENVVISRFEGEPVELYVDGTAKTCEVQTNTGERHTYTPGTTIAKGIYSWIEACSVFIDSIGLEHTGEWKITSNFADNSTSNTATFKVYTKQRATLTPFDDLIVYEGYYAAVKIDAEIKNLTYCTAIAPNRTKIDLLNVNRKDFYRFGQCGFRALMNEGDSGEWELNAIENDSTIHTGVVSIRVLKETNEHSEVKVISLERRGEGRLNLDIKTGITYCQLEDPTGAVSPIITEICRYTIPVVTTRHEGVWIARYGVTGKQDPVVLPFRVITYDPQTMDSDVTLTENNDIQLLCHVYSSTPRALAYCQFTRPDGYVLNLSPGVGTNSYSAFNVSQGRQPRSNLYCGLIIHEPREYDYGSWKCGLVIDNNEYAGSVIHVTPGILGASEIQNSDGKVTVSARRVYVKQNDPFQIKCTADAALSYCWFRSPNGTAYSVSQKTFRTPFTLPYVGFGLLSGECAAKIDHADFTDQGEWTCNVGVVNGTEERQTFLVTVAETYVIPERTQLMARSGDNIILSCNILPSVTERAVHYCRWIRPDGYGIYNGISHRYTTNTSDTQCKLIIASVRGEEDIGRWTCVAGLAGSDIEEAWATVTVRSLSTGYHVLIGVSLGATIMLIAVVCALCLVHVRRRRRALPIDPPAYTPEPGLPPKCLQPEYVSKEFRY